MLPQISKMSEPVQIWLFGIIGAWLLANTLLIAKLRDDLFRIRLAVLALGKRAAEILHSPDDHLGIDNIIDRLVILADKYKKREYELSAQEWNQLRETCKVISSDPLMKKNERVAAALLGFATDVCNHKMQKFMGEI